MLMFQEDLTNRTKISFQQNDINIIYLYIFDLFLESFIIFNDKFRFILDFPMCYLFE